MAAFRSKAQFFTYDPYARDFNRFFLAVLPKVSAINRAFGYFYLLICASLQDWIKMPLLSALATGLRSGTQNAGTHITKKNAEDVGELAEQLADLDLGI